MSESVAKMILEVKKMEGLKIRAASKKEKNQVTERKILKERRKKMKEINAK